MTTKDYNIINYTDFKQLLNTIKPEDENTILLYNKEMYNMFKRPYNKLKNLKDFRILLMTNFNKYNKINRLNIYYMKQLINLTITANLTNISPKIKNLFNLLTLDLNSNLLIKIPDEICKLNNLKELNLNYNKLNEIPHKLSALNELNKLYLNYNELENINILMNDKICFRNLIELTIVGNKLSKIPDFIYQLNKLEILNLSSNNINMIEDDISNLTNLTKLNLRHNNIYDINESFYNLSQLKWLDLSKNNITDIDYNCCKLYNLNYLNLSSNILLDVENILNITSLTLLFLSDNVFNEISDNINKLINLSYIDLSNNLELEYLSSNILNIPGIDIEISDTPLLTLSDSLMRYIYNIPINGFINDDENVHNSSIQNTMKESIINLLKDDYDIKLSTLINEIKSNIILSKEEMRILVQDLLADDRILYDSSNKNYHTIDYFTLFIKIWGRINSNDNKIELYKRLYEEISDGLYLCFVGKITRLINCLVGYYDDIHIGLSDNETIGNIIITYLNNRPLNPQLKEELNTILSERGFSTELINNWLII